MIWKNNGKIYTNEAGKNDLGGAAPVPGAGDFDVEYTPKESYTYTCLLYTSLKRRLPRG